ncbi:MAG: hypothetical protein LE180_06445 [Endomicrobium sp.]|nr:hypothetical protein [Endomicrobium sp.]
MRITNHLKINYLKDITTHNIESYKIIEGNEKVVASTINRELHTIKAWS